MLKIYPVCLEMLRAVTPLARQVGRHDADLARQLRRSSMSVFLNVAEGSGCRGGNQRLRFETALGSARETLANLQASEAVGYIGGIDPSLEGRFDHIIGTLVRLVVRR